MAKRGWIALDIDGTITLDKYSVPKEVTSYLRGLSDEGWSLALATGRPFAFASMALTEFDFPYIFLAQNGSVALEMPEKRLLFKAYIPPTSILMMERAYEGIDSDFLVYRGYDRGDACFWRPEKFSHEEHEYLADLQTRQKERWQEVREFPHEPFPLIKCFGSEDRLHRIARFLRSTQLFEVAHIRDPFVAGMYLLLVTDIHTSKGKSLSRVFQMKGRGAQVIAAGDDENDLSLLEVADTKIAMKHAPASVKKMADLIAPPTEECGIIAALKQAIHK
ncbi:MAG: Cof-type HAD-IIB family hydrolase [Verrucomicrobia bacterium]|nr:Cof-type HAD-IIB family hydrolase [Verrucomicrobiota bacterium]MDE3047338.1 HAD family phosphatase [Verrucomicrobiota bacterium]